MVVEKLEMRICCQRNLKVGCLVLSTYVIEYAQQTLVRATVTELDRDRSDTEDGDLWSMTTVPT